MDVQAAVPLTSIGGSSRESVRDTSLSYLINPELRPSSEVFVRHNSFLRLKNNEVGGAPGLQVMTE